MIEERFRTKLIATVFWGMATGVVVAIRQSLGLPLLITPITAALFFGFTLPKSSDKDHLLSRVIWRSMVFVLSVYFGSLIGTIVVS